MDFDRKFICGLCNKTLNGLNTITKHQAGATGRSACIDNHALNWRCLDDQNRGLPRGSADNLYIRCAYPHCNTDIGCMKTLRMHYTSVHGSTAYRNSKTAISKAKADVKAAVSSPFTHQPEPRNTSSSSLDALTFEFHASNSDYSFLNEMQSSVGTSHLHMSGGEKSLKRASPANISSTDYFSPDMLFKKPNLAASAMTDFDFTEMLATPQTHTPPIQNSHSNNIPSPSFPSPSASTPPIRLEHTVSAITPALTKLKDLLDKNLLKNLDMTTPIQNALKQAENDTQPRKWLLDKVGSWFNGTNSFFETPTPVFCVVGGTGTGKTVVVAALLDEYKDGNDFAGSPSFFFQHDEPERNTAEAFIRAIAYQLAKSDSGVQDRIYKTFQEQPGCIIHGPIKVLLHELIIKPLRSRVSEKPILICIDALDECTDPASRQELVDHLRTLKWTLHPLVKLFITMRPDSVLMDAFSFGEDEDSGFSSQQSICTRIDLDKSANCNDLITFAKSHMTKRWTRCKLRPETRNEIAEGLAHAADGLFIWLAVAFREIEKGFSGTWEHQAREIIANGGLMHKNGHNHLAQLYLETLARVPELQDKDVLEGFSGVVGTLVCLRRPVTVDVLEELAAVEGGSGMAGHVLPMVAPLLNPVKEKEGITFVHKSVRDFLTSPDAGKFLVNSSECHKTIAKNCLRLLLATSLGRGMSDATLADVFRGIIPPTKAFNIASSMQAETQYAFMHWMDHVTDSFDFEDISFGKFRSRFGVPALLASYKKSHERLIEKLLDCEGGAKLLLKTESVLYPQPKQAQQQQQQPPSPPTKYLKLPPLFEAAGHGRASVVKILLKAGADPDCMGVAARNFVPLHFAAQNASLQDESEEQEQEDGFTKVVRLLMDAKADPCKLDNFGLSALHYAAMNGRADILLALLSNTSVKPFQKGHSSVIRVLIDYGASCDAVDGHGWTPLFYAALAGRTEAAMMLLECGASVDLLDRDGWTPLHWAAENTHQDMMHLLLGRMGRDLVDGLSREWCSITCYGCWDNLETRAASKLKAGSDRYIALDRDKQYKKCLHELTVEFDASPEEVEKHKTDNQPTTGNLVNLFRRTFDVEEALKDKAQTLIRNKECSKGFQDVSYSLVLRVLRNGGFIHLRTQADVDVIRKPLTKAKQADHLEWIKANTHRGFRTGAELILLTEAGLNMLSIDCSNSTKKIDKIGQTIVADSWGFNRLSNSLSERATD
ncbi:hypothetical protein HDU80_006314 [Chytriomyces hyalinus]|nr:hypothetical protein HDU80_006314 [Chytriomyces hyalinus]